jgi:hypothetical protein
MRVHQTKELLHSKRNYHQTQEKAAWRFLKKPKIKLPYDPVIPFLDIYPKEHKSRYNRDTSTSVFIAHYSQ